jgi:hypothetical protein
MSDSYGDGWNAAVITINGETFGLAAGASGTESFMICDPLTYADSTYSITAGGYPSEITWSIDCGDDGSLSGG